jgi:hypothetical protein
VAERQMQMELGCVPKARTISCWSISRQWLCEFACTFAEEFGHGGYRPVFQPDDRDFEGWCRKIDRQNLERWTVSAEMERTVARDAYEAAVRK